MAEAFFVEPRTVMVRDRSVEVKPLRVKHLSRAARLAEPILRAVSDEGTTGVNWVRVMQHADEVVGLCALATGLDEEFVGDLELDELMAIASAVFEVNADFFVRRLLPAAVEAMGRIAPAIPPTLGDQLSKG
jgi:hypothetical protein